MVRSKRPSPIYSPIVSPIQSPIESPINAAYRLNAAWTPADIASCRLMLDATDLSTLFTDTGGTTPVTASGQSVAAWRDKTDNATLFTEATLGNRPVYTESGGLKYLQFTGASQQRLSATVDMSGTDAVTIVAGIRRDSSANMTILNQNELATQSFLLAIALSGNNLQMFSRGDGALRSGAVAGGTPPISNVVTGFADISAPIVNVHNGDTEGTGSTGSQGAGNYSNSQIRIGQRTTGINHLDGRLYRLALFTTLLTDDELTLAKAWALRDGE